MAVLTCAGVRPFSIIKAAIPAACGAAAEVPKNGLNPGVAQLTPSAAAISGLCLDAPPVEETFPGVMAVPFAV